jgi:hypothetical protein
MAYTPEQEFQLELESQRAANQDAAEMKRAKLESVRLAKEILLENARNKPIDDREVSADEITAFAETLISYVNS